MRRAADELDPAGRTTGFLPNPVIVTMIGDLPIERLFHDQSTRLGPELLARTIEHAQGRPDNSLGHRPDGNKVARPPRKRAPAPHVPGAGARGVPTGR